MATPKNTQKPQTPPIPPAPPTATQKALDNLAEAVVGIAAKNITSGVAMIDEGVARDKAAAAANALSAAARATADAAELERLRQEDEARQQAEAEAQKDIESGNVTEFESVDDLLAHLKGE